MHPVAVRKASTELTFKDSLNHLRCRLGAFRMKYTVQPGLYAVGAPGKGSDVFLSANYGMSFNILRSSLRGMDAWILVLDTRGINVWCAAGKGTFGTDEIIRRVRESRLAGVVSHRRLIAPQLGAPGIRAHVVQKETGFRIHYGPVRAGDIPEYVRSGYKASKGVRTVNFKAAERAALTPMEIRPALKYFPAYVLAVLFVFGLKPDGVIFRDAFTGGWPFIVLGLLSVFSGAFLAPVLLPFIPGRSFAVKGLLTGLPVTAVALSLMAVESTTLYLLSMLLYPALSSYLALQFTGSTVFTGPSGVRKELRFAVPAYLAVLAVSASLILVYKMGELLQ